MLCCKFRKKRHTAARLHPDAQYKREMFGMMLAKLDEFESLTPLVLTPESMAENSCKVSRINIPSYSESPPPPRRVPTGKTLIFPLNASKRLPAVTMLGNSDSRLTYENGGLKSCATIPEDDENVQSSSNDDVIETDLISIDRTSLSWNGSRNLRNQGYNELLTPSLPPKFEIPTPLYSPPSPPPIDQLRPLLFICSPKNGISRRDLKIENNNANGGERVKCPSHESINSFSSPQDSSFGSGSPIDTSGSISDSFYLASENCGATSETKCKCYNVESGKIYGAYLDSEVDNFKNGADEQSQRKFLLHRIEEESDVDELHGMVVSGTLDSIKSATSFTYKVDAEQNIILPRSISEQFEMMNTM